MLWYVFILLCFSALMSTIVLMIPEADRPATRSKNWSLVLSIFLHSLAAYFVGLTLFSVGG